ncbi:hypothetical protein D3C76_723940 [compost metagenome]
MDSFLTTLAIIIFSMFMLGTGYTLRERNSGLALMWIGVLSMLSVITYRIYIATSAV